jgi:tetratricopeptide (TPR) repeat protein
MKKRNALVLLPVLLSAALAIMLGGCGKKKDEGKIAITSSSSEALSEFLIGRTLYDNLRIADSLEHFQKALAKDPNFAMAHLYFAQAAGTNTELFDHLKQAVALSGNVSEGERLCILGLEAGTYRDPIKQRELYQKLVALFPVDAQALTLLGINYFVQQDYQQAAEYLKKATVVAPAFAPAYNQLGYSYLSLNQLADAENAFKKYTELIPNDPNPYDSYAELLLKTGRFEEAIAQYRKALSLNPQFASSFNGIAAALMYQGKHADALAEIQKAYDKARNEGEQRAALFTKTIIYVDQGQPDPGLAEMEKQYAIAEKGKDVASMANDLIAMGSILLELGKWDAAQAQFDKAAAIVAQAELPAAVKSNAERFHHYNKAQVALLKKDFNTANAELDQFRQRAEEIKAQNQIRLVHETRGMIALMQKNYDGAITELEQANQQDPYNHYRVALAYQGKGDKEKATQYFTQAAKFNGLPSLNYAFIRTKAEKILAKS